MGHTYRFKALRHSRRLVRPVPSRALTPVDAAREGSHHQASSDFPRHNRRARALCLGSDCAVQAVRFRAHVVERDAQALHSSELRGRIVGVWVGFSIPQPYSK